jgi:signal transduction histidine kinase
MTRDGLGVVSHELRSPVAALAALAEGAAGAPLPEHALRRVIALALAAGRDVERLLADPHVLSLRLAEVDLADVLEPLAGPGVSLSGTRVRVLCDPTRVRQVVRNLVANGLRHGTAVSIDWRRDGDHALVQVGDDGPGVDPRIDAFARGVSTVASSGYGLWLGRAIAEAHGGTLELTGGRGRGAVFTLCLPLACAERG